MTATMERIEIDGLTFDIRVGTSDEKAIREVVQRRGYGRYKFTPAPGEFWLDLGANVGAFSVWAASQDRSIKLHAYEPDPDMCELIHHNLKLNRLHKQVDVIQAAVVADRRRTVTLHCNTARGNVWRNSIEREWRGGEDITVPAINIKKVIADSAYHASRGAGTFMKMDVEGTEMPLLEWLIAHPNELQMIDGMVFEWSFDVDRSIPRFQSVIAGLGQHFGTIKNAQLPDDAPAEWPAQWNPPCRVVWAWNEG
jgi:FkbM family methyltransferase